MDNLLNEYETKVNVTLKAKNDFFKLVKENKKRVIKTEVDIKIKRNRSKKRKKKKMVNFSILLQNLLGDDCFLLVNVHESFGGDYIEFESNRDTLSNTLSVIE